MFSKETDKVANSRTARVPSIISANLRIVGDLVSDGDVQVDGAVEGDVRACTITVSEGAEVKGQVMAESVCIRGFVEGEITAAKVELGRTAKVLGDIVHKDLAIQSGAFLEGHCRRMEKSVEEIPSLSESGDDTKPRPQVAASA